MTTIQSLIDSFRRDFASFALTGSPIEITASGSIASVQWTHGKTHRETKLRVMDDGTVQALVAPETWVPYKQFLGSESMADLRFVASRILSRIEGVRHFTPVKLRKEVEEAKGGINYSLNALDTLSAYIGSSLETRRTGVFFLRGEAGCGKSILLKQLARAHAQSYLDGTSDRICLYIDAQGKALLSLHDAFSSVCDDLSITSIRKDTIPVLCRHGLLIPLVDGFDELLGSGGFGEAFNSLGAFLADLDGKGTLIASGRSTFYDQQQLQITASRFSASIDYTTSTAEVLPWDDEQIRNYCAANWTEEPDKGNLLKVLEGLLRIETNKKLLGKPFFSAELAELLPHSPELGANESLVDALIKSFVEREAGKWLDRQGNRVLPLDMHLDLLSAFAEEMWWTNTRELDLETIRTLTELQVEKRPAEHRNIAIQRSSFHGCLQTSSPTGGRLGFQHAVYFEYFLHRHLETLINSGDGERLQLALERDLLSDSLLELFALAHAQDSLEKIRKHINFACQTSRSGARHQLSRQNLGAFVASLLDERNTALQKIRLTNLDFIKVNLRHITLHEPAITNCLFENVRLNGSKLLGAQFINCRLDRVMVDDDTVIDCALRPGEDVTSIIYKDEGLPTYDPAQVRKILEKVGSRPPAVDIVELTPSQQKCVDILERFLKKMERNFYLGEDLEIAWGLARLPEWEEIKALLYKHSLLERKKVPRRGPKGELPVLTRTPEQIRLGQSSPSHSDSRVAAFWRDIYSS
jgi:uncharacterized protein YjbI with pentapeptide repeats